MGPQTLISYELLWNASQLKQNAYAEQREARVLFTGDAAAVRSSDIHKTRVRGNESVSYVDLPFAPSLRSRSLPKRVIVGPAAPPEAVPSTRQFLQTAASHDIQRNIPYRSLR